MEEDDAFLPAPDECEEVVSCALGGRRERVHGDGLQLRHGAARRGLVRRRFDDAV